MIFPRFVSVGFGVFQIEKGDLLCLTDIHITSITLRENVFNYEKDYNILSNMAKNQRAINAIENFAKEKQRVTYIVIDPLFSKCKFKREGWIK